MPSTRKADRNDTADGDARPASNAAPPAPPPVPAPTPTAPQSVLSLPSVSAPTQADAPINSTAPPPANSPVLLTSVPTSSWIDRRVRVLAGVARGKVGTVARMINGWVHVTLDAATKHGGDCSRRANELEILADGVAEQAAATEHPPPAAAESPPAKKKRIRFRGTGKLLSSAAITSWPGRLVKIKVGPMTGKIGRVLKWGNGWVHMTIDLSVTAANFMFANSDACRRAHELEIVREPKSLRFGTVDPAALAAAAASAEASAGPPEEAPASDPEPVPTAPTSAPPASALRTSRRPPPSVDLGRPYARRPIRVGAEYQCSVLPAPGGGKSTRAPPVVAWIPSTLPEEQAAELLQEFVPADHAMVLAEVQGGTGTDQERCRHARRKVLEKRAGFLQVERGGGEKEKEKEKEEEVLVSEGRPRKKRRKSLLYGTKFHARAKTSRKNSTRLQKLSLPDLLQKTYQRWPDPIMGKVFAESKWAQIDTAG